MGFQQGLAGLNASSKALDNIGNNIANTNTVGYKSSRPIFADLVADQLGAGVYVSSVEGNFKQGTPSTTGNTLDLAIEGNGFFQVNTAGGLSFYTRAGQFHQDANGNVVDANGYFLQGYQAGSSGALTGTLGTISVGNAVAAPLSVYRHSTTAQFTTPRAAYPCTPSATNPNITSATALITHPKLRVTLLCCISVSRVSIVQALAPCCVAF